MHDEEGHAVLDAFLVGLILMMPLMWMLIAASSLHRAAFASTSAAREAGLIAARSDSAADAHSRAQAAVARALSEQGVDPDVAKVSLYWAPERDAPVRIEVQVPVKVFAIPFVSRHVGPAILVKARHVAHADPYRSLDV